MELIELKAEEVQQLFYTGWERGPTRGLCRWQNRTYMWSGKEASLGEGLLSYIYPVSIDEVVKIEVNHKHLCGVISQNRSVQNISNFIPTLRLIDLACPEITEQGLWTRAVHWWIKETHGGRDYTTDKKPVAFWRGNRPVQ